MRDLNGRTLADGDAVVTYRDSATGAPSWLIACRVVAPLDKRGLVVVEAEDGEPLIRHPRNLAKVWCP